MKVLLLDNATKGIISMVYTMSQILEKEVYLVETLDSAHEAMMHMKAVCFLRPTQANITRLAAELKAPKYAEYYICASLPAPACGCVSEWACMRCGALAWHSVVCAANLLPVPSSVL